MPLQNRVAPTGDILADPSKAGIVMGNRGILHDGDKTLGQSRWRHKAWIICVTSFKDFRRELMAPGQYTELFFLDEAVAIAAGHRPCSLCRRAAFQAYFSAIEPLMTDKPSASALDALLHRSRVNPANRRQIVHQEEAHDLPQGAFIAHDGASWLVWNDGIHRFTFEGYTERRPLPDGRLTVLTPRPSLEALRGGYVPVVHPSIAG